MTDSQSSELDRLMGLARKWVSMEAAIADARAIGESDPYADREAPVAEEALRLALSEVLRERGLYKQQVLLRHEKLEASLAAAESRVERAEQERNEARREAERLRTRHDLHYMKGSVLAYGTLPWERSDASASTTESAVKSQVGERSSASAPEENR